VSACSAWRSKHGQAETASRAVCERELTGELRASSASRTLAHSLDCGNPTPHPACMDGLSSLLCDFFFNARAKGHNLKRRRLTRCLPARVSLPGNRADVGTLGSLLCVREVLKLQADGRVCSSLTL
jgi:hypothetical protein